MGVSLDDDQIRLIEGSVSLSTLIFRGILLIIVCAAVALMPVDLFLPGVDVSGVPLLALRGPIISSLILALMVAFDPGIRGRITTIDTRTRNVVRVPFIFGIPMRSSTFQPAGEVFIYSDHLFRRRLTRDAHSHIVQEERWIDYILSIVCENGSFDIYKTREKKEARKIGELVAATLGAKFKEVSIAGHVKVHGD